jgi:hypothetical protein
VVQASNNAEVWRWDSDPFGANGQTTAFMYYLRFPGQYVDQETGLHQYLPVENSPDSRRSNNCFLENGLLSLEK